jgi:nucleoside-diphosphate-sugar epimerase
MVTGGGGFIGSHVLRELLRRGYKAVAFRHSTGVEPIADIAAKIGFAKGEITDQASIVDAIKKNSVTHIVHTVSLLTAESQKKPLTALKINVEGTVNVLEAARLADVHQFVYLSSTAVYGYTEEGKIIEEEHPQRPVTIYGATKLLCEHYGLNYSNDYGLGFIALRFPIVYGPGQSTRGFNSFKEVIEKPVFRQPARVPLGGNQKYEGVYVKDAASAVVSACFVDKPEHRIFNIGTGEMHTLQDLANIVKEIAPNAVFKIGPGFDIAEPVKGPLSITKAKKELEYKPRFNLEKGVKDYIKSLKSESHFKGQSAK